MLQTQGNTLFLQALPACVKLLIHLLPCNALSQGFNAYLSTDCHLATLPLTLILVRGLSFRMFVAGHLEVSA